jgi:hypothetical protein
MNLGVLTFVLQEQLVSQDISAQEQQMKSQWLARAAVVAALVISPIVSSAQSALASADAASFLGTWTLTLDSPQGAFEQTLSLKDVNGKVAAEMNSPIQPGPQEITDVSKSGTDLVLKFQGDFQGTAFSAKITLTPDGNDKASVSFDVMDGQFVMQGSGVKK